MLSIIVSLCVSFILAIVLSVFRFTASNYPFGILKRFLAYQYTINVYMLFEDNMTYVCINVVQISMRSYDELQNR
jgi:hypothetical protein